MSFNYHLSILAGFLLQLIVVLAVTHNSFSFHVKENFTSPSTSVKPFNYSLETVCTVHDNAVEVSSDNYPNPYPHELSKTWCFDFPTAIGFQIKTEDFNLDSKHDYLTFTEKNPDFAQEEDNECQMVVRYTGHTAPNFEMFDEKTVIVKFYSNNSINHTFKGFKLKVVPLFIRVKSVQGTGTVFPTLKKSLIISQEDQKNPDLWNVTIRDILVESTNKWLTRHNLNRTLEECKPDNVFLENVKSCPSSWPDNNNCARFEFGINLKQINDEIYYQIVNLTTKDNKIELDDYELSKKNLEKVWNEFVQFKLLEAGYPEYKLPNTTVLLVVWAFISLFIIGLFLAVLYAIWRTDVLKNYLR